MNTDEPRWLDEEESDAWLALAPVLLTLPAALDAQLQRDAGMTFYEYLVLAALSNVEDHALRLRDLAVVTSGSLPRLSQVVTRMEGKGWVRRAPHPHDRRCTLAVLTTAGRRELEEAAPGHVETVRRLVFDPLTRTQVSQLKSVHRRIRDAVAPGSPALPAR